MEEVVPAIACFNDHSDVDFHSWRTIAAGSSRTAARASSRSDRLVKVQRFISKRSRRFSGDARRCAPQQGPRGCLFYSTTEGGIARKGSSKVWV